MATTTADDDLRIKIFDVLGVIRDIVDAIPEIYDALRPIAERYPKTLHDIHLDRVRAEFDAISMIAHRAGEIIDEAEKKEDKTE